jgi:hypothetical protein
VIFTIFNIGREEAHNITMNGRNHFVE